MASAAHTITVILGHPLADSFCAALADAYATGARAAGAEVRRQALGEMSFDPILRRGYRAIQELEPDLKAAQENILWADHLVFAFPVWWGVPPALMKGFLDRTFVPGFAFKYASKDSLFQQKLLRGRSARLLCTMDAPSWYYRLLVGAPGVRMMRRSVLEFCGVSPVRASLFGSVRLSSPERRKRWLAAAASLGRRCA